MLHHGTQVLRGSFKTAAFLVHCKHYPGCLIPAVTHVLVLQCLQPSLSPAQLPCRPGQSKFHGPRGAEEPLWSSERFIRSVLWPAEGIRQLGPFFLSPAHVEAMQIWHNPGLYYSSEVTWCWDLSTSQFHGVLPSYSHHNFIFSINICKLPSFKSCLLTPVFWGASENCGLPSSLWCDLPLPHFLLFPSLCFLLSNKGC